MGFEGGKIDLDDLVVESSGVLFDLRVGAKERGLGVSEACQPGSPGSLQVGGHAPVVGKDRGGGTQLRSHVADGGLAGGRQAFGAGPEVLDDLVGAALDGEHAAQFEDDVLGGGPTRKRAAEADPQDLGQEDLPRYIDHDIDGVGAPDTHRAHAQAAGVRAV